MLNCRTPLVWVGTILMLSCKIQVSTQLLNLKNQTINYESDAHLLWFLQISDLHLNFFQDFDRITEFREFCHYTIDVIKPSLVIASGDLTDARNNIDLRTVQVRSEWESYANALHENNVYNKTIWMDIRGNHDGFNVLTLNSQQNYFGQYSVQGKENPRSYFKQLTKNNVTYSFVALDVSLVPGHREPFHFLGFLDNSQVTLAKNIIREIKESGSNYTVWFGHFPTSATVTRYPGGIRALIAEDHHVYAYLTGHLHNYGRLVPKMFTLHSEGFLELELGDWQKKRLFRLLAFDHGFLSFVDVYHREWPIILITNPKHALFIVPKQEDINIIKESTHIRVLVFSLSKIRYVKIKINDEDWVICTNTKGPLFVAKWSPENYAKGIHTLHVIAKDMDGREKIITQPFALDGTTLHFDLSAELSLKVDLALIFKISFAIMFLISVLPLFTLRCLHKLVKDGIITKPSLKSGCCSHRLRKFWILVTIDKIFWPLLLYPIYMACGPWLVGSIIEDSWGVIFIWGIYVNDSFLPGGVTYDVAALQLMLFYIPLVMVLANGVNWRFEKILNKQCSAFMTILHHIVFQSSFGLILLVQSSMIYFCISQYGIVSTLLGPIPTWSSLYAIILWYNILLLPEDCMREATRLWAIKLEPEQVKDT